MRTRGQSAESAPRRTLRRLGLYSLAGRLMWMQLGVVVVLVAVAGLALILESDSAATREAGQRSRAVAMAFADAPGTARGLAGHDPTAALQPQAERVRHETGVDLVVVFSRRGIRYTHPNPKLIGKHVVGPYKQALTRGTFTRTFKASTGVSVTSVAPVHRRDGSVAGLVSVGITTQHVQSMASAQLPVLLGGAAGALVLSAAGTVLLGRRLRSQTHGLGPAEMTRMYEHHDAVLHSVREGVLIMDAGHRLLLANDEALRLLGLGPHAEGELVTDLGLDPHTAGLLTSHRAVSDAVCPAGDRLLALNMRPTGAPDDPAGKVATLRDTTDLRALSGRAEAARERLRLLHDAGARVGTTLDVRRTAREMAEVAVPRFADLVTVELADQVLRGDEPPGPWVPLRRTAVSAAPPRDDRGTHAGTRTDDQANAGKATASDTTEHHPKADRTDADHPDTGHVTDPAETDRAGTGRTETDRTGTDRAGTDGAADAREGALGGGADVRPYAAASTARFPVDALVTYAAPAPQARALESGRAVLVRGLAEEETGPEGADQQTRGGREPGLRSLIAVPVRARGVVLGMANFWRYEGSDPFDEDDRSLAEELVGRTGVSIDNARRFAHEHATAVTLQHSLLPAGLPEQDAVEAAYRYLPAQAAEAEVGGDWFDVIPLSGARVALVVGDVVGHGVHAAATMGRLRTAVHNFSALDLPPDELLGYLDELVSRIDDSLGAGVARTTGATCLYAIYDPVSGRCTMATNGHPGPALLRPDGTVTFPTVPASPPLGLGGEPFETAELEVDEGSRLVLFTDGLVADRDRDLDTGLDQLRTALSGLRGRSPEEICQNVLDAVLPPRPSDDVALLVARTNRLDAEHLAEWTMDRDPAVVARVRTQAADRLATWGLESLSFATELILSELVTNAVRYGTAPIRVRLLRTRSLICEVADDSPTAPHLRRAAATDEGGRGLYLVSRFAERWGTRYSDGGKVVWTEQSLAPGAPPATELTDEALLDQWDDSAG